MELRGFKYWNVFLLMKKLITLGLMAICLMYSVSGFNLTESVSLYSTNRMEARIQDFWLTSSNMNSHLMGFLSVPHEFGYFNLYYEGNDLLNNHRSLYSYVEVTNTYIGQYGWHFDGICPYTVITENGRPYYYMALWVDGFYNPESRQIYLSWGETKTPLGSTWVSFSNQYRRLEAVPI